MGFDINSSRTGSKSLLTYGYETHSLNDWSLHGRLNISRVIMIEATGHSGINELSSSSPEIR